MARYGLSGHLLLIRTPTASSGFLGKERPKDLQTEELGEAPLQGFCPNVVCLMETLEL